jgi:hypothetical protein
MYPTIGIDSAFKKMIDEYFMHLDNEFFSIDTVDQIEEQMGVI